MNRATIGRLLISAVALETGIGSFIADFASSHVFNPNWNPHSRFHAAVGVFVSAGLMVLSLHCAWRRAGDVGFNLRMSAWLAALFMGSFIPAGIVPGAGYEEPGLPRPMVFGVLAPQLLMAIVSVLLVLVGYWLARPSATTPAPSPGS
jgi:hypothetical protein